MEDAIHDYYLDRHNADPKPFVWSKSADVILHMEPRAFDALEVVNGSYQASGSEHARESAEPDALGCDLCARLD